MDWNSEEELYSSDDTSYDSDIIDSDIEADLYSVIHYQQENSFTSSNEFDNSIKTENTPHVIKIENPSNEYSILEKPEVVKSNSLELSNRTKANIGDKTVKKTSLNSSKNFKNYVEVQTIEFKNELNQGKLNKRKSSVVSDLLNNIQSKAKKGKVSETNRGKEISVCDEIYHLTSDDDSDIMYLSPEETGKQFQTNLSRCTINLDDSSDSDDSWYDKFPNRASISFSNKNKDLWYVNNEDAYRFRRRTNNRYHESDQGNCNNCGEKGHFAKNCSAPPPVMKCYICGSKHNPRNCKRQTCANCFRDGHDSRFCKLGVTTCSLCNMTGHPSDECPDLWRRYHLTTTSKGIRANKHFREEPIFCYNCGAAGHFGGNCVKWRMNTTSYPTWPIVINYVAPYSTFKPSKNKNSFIDFEENIAKKMKFKSKTRKERKMWKYARMDALETQQKEFPRTPKSEIANKSSKKKALKTQQNDSPKTPAAEKAYQKLKEAHQNQQNDSPQTDVDSQISKALARKKKNQDKAIRRLEILRSQILAQSKNISIPLLDLSGQNELPYSYKSLKNRAKKERKLLRKLISETHSSNEKTSPLINKN